MASPSSAAIFLLFLLSMASVLPSHALIIRSLNVSGILYCSTTGNSCPTCQGLGGVNVSITCSILGSTSTTSVLTDSSGLFSTVLNLANGILVGVLNTPILPCVATVQLPVANCTLLPSTGILQAPLTLVGGLLPGVLGLLGQAVTAVFSLVT